MKKNTLFIFILWQFTIACSDNKNSKVLLLNDFHKRQDFEFETLQSEKDGYVEAVFIDVKGKLEGNLRIGGSCGSDITGKIDTTFRCDWYSPKASMLVIPLGQVTGDLKITFRFSKI